MVMDSSIPPSYNRTMKNIVIFVFAIIVGLGLVALYTKFFPVPIQKIEKEQTVPPASHFSIEHAPSNSIKATIATFSGKVEWLSRVATEASRLTTIRKLQQGEDIATDETGTATLQFPNLGSITLQPNTKLSIIQTIPADIVLQQNSGSVIYEKTGTLPLSIHSLALLIEQKVGTMRVTVNTNRDIVTVTVTKGSVTAAFEDGNNTTQLREISEGHILQFDSDANEAIIK